MATWNSHSWNAYSLRFVLFLSWLFHVVLFFLMLVFFSNSCKPGIEHYASGCCTVVVHEDERLVPAGIERAIKLLPITYPNTYLLLPEYADSFRPFHLFLPLPIGVAFSWPE